ARRTAGNQRGVLRINGRAAPRVDPGDAKRQFVQGSFARQLAAAVEQHLDDAGMLFRFRRVSTCGASGACRATGDIHRIFGGEPEFARAERELLDKTIALKNWLYD